MSACVICAREAEFGYLDAACFSRLSSMLRDIEDEAAMIDAAPSMALRTGTGGGSSRSERSPARLTALAFLDPRTRRWEPDAEPRYTPPSPKAIGPWCLLCEHETCTAWRAGRRRDLHDDEHDAGSAALASVLGELHNWARLIREERELSAPKTITVTGERDLLSRHIVWCSEQPWIDEMFADLKKLLGQLRTINRTQPEKPEGICQLPTDDGVCSGRIWRRDVTRVAWRVKTDRCEREAVKTADGVAYCERCGEEWDGEALDRLHLIQEQRKTEAARPKTEDGRRMLTAQEMADRLGVALTAFRMRASRQGARAVSGHYDPAMFEQEETRRAAS